MGQSAIEEIHCNQYEGTQLILVKQVIAPTPHLLCQPHRLYCVFMLDSNSLLFYLMFSCFFPPFSLIFLCFLCFCPMLFTPEMRSSKYSSKWCGFLSCCLCPSVSVSACLFPACWLLFPSAFGSFSSLHFWFLFSSVLFFFFSFLFFFFPCHFWGSQSWGCLSCLSVTGRYTCQSLWLTDISTALIN